MNVGMCIDSVDRNDDDRKYQLFNTIASSLKPQPSTLKYEIYNNRIECRMKNNETKQRKTTPIPQQANEYTDYKSKIETRAEDENEECNTIIYRFSSS